jgi:hypothetical protein
MIICRRDGTGFNQMLVTARELAEEMETSSAFESSGQLDHEERSVSLIMSLLTNQF